MRAYELMIIFDGDSTDEVVDEHLGRLDENVAAIGGEVATTDKWGKRRFAYPIDHKTEGVYVVLEIVTPGGDLSAAERALRLADPVVRHKLIRLPDGEADRRGLFGRTPTGSANGQE